MKDVPHHMKKLNRRIVRSERRIKNSNEGYEMSIPAPPEQAIRPKEQRKKQAKIEMRKERENRTPIKKTKAERNREMKQRTPVFDRLNTLPEKISAKPPKKQHQLKSKLKK